MAKIVIEKDKVIIEKSEWLKIQKSMKKIKEQLKKLQAQEKDRLNSPSVPILQACQAELDKTISQIGES